MQHNLEDLSSPTKAKIECMFFKLERVELLTEREPHMAVFWQKQIIFQNILLIHGH